MRAVHTTRRTVLAVCTATVLLAALTFAATGRGSSASGTQGVTKDAVKVGIAIIDYDALKDFVDFSRGDQEKTAQVFVDYINKNGGIDGRKIVPVYKKYTPIPGRQPDPLSLCTAWAEDDKVFAVLGVFIDFTGQGQLCLTKEHHLVHIGHELEQPWIDAAPGGLLVTADSTKDLSSQILLNLLNENGKLKGKKVAVLADKDAQSRVDDVILPELKKHKVKTGSTAILTITGTDTSAAQAQLDSFIEKWKTEKVNTVFLTGLTVSAKQFVETIKDAMPNVQLISDADATLKQARGEAQAGKDPNPYEGMLSVTGLTPTERWAKKGPLLQQCVDIYEKATGETVKGPDEEEVVDGKTVELDVAVTDFCGELFMFRDIAKKVGPNLTTANWQKTVDKLGPIELVPNSISSLCKGKYTGNDGYRLVEYDSSLSQDGDWKKVTPIQDASGGKCAKVGGGSS